MRLGARVGEISCGGLSQAALATVRLLIAWVREPGRGARKL